MKKYTGKAACNGIAVGSLLVLKRENLVIEKKESVDREQEILRLEKAKQDSLDQLQKIYEDVLEKAGEESAAIFEVHQMMLEDDDYNDTILEAINEEGLTAEEAVEQTGNQFAEIFASMDDEYMKARAADIKDISGRIIRNLMGKNDLVGELKEPVIIVADDLAPSETASLDKNMILAFVTVGGSLNSHTAILARMMNIPALIGVPVDLEEIATGMEAIADGNMGVFIVEPDEDEKKKAEAAIHEELQKQKLLLELKGKENVTKGGRRIHIFANIGSVSDVSYAIENDAGGIGLFRSEFLYIGRSSLPDEEEQFEAYKETLELMGDKKVVVRTLDIGADKQADYLNLDKEENPALGYRAIRICLKQPEIFKTQLRALYRASVYGNLAIMYPMITSVREIMEIKKISAEVKQELQQEGLSYRDVEEGIMIETPAAALISDELATLVDFFSVGTNDLSQYTMAIDRQNDKLDEFFDPHHKAVLKLIKMAADNIHKEGKWIGICGELGADTELTEEFLNMGIDELSVSPSMVLKVRKAVLEIED